MNLTDLHELKKFLELDPNDTSEDAMLNFLIEYASDWIAEWMNRPGLFYRQRTGYYDLRGPTQKLPLPCRPVFCDANRTITVVLDTSGGYGQIPGTFTGNPLTYGTDYYLKLDDPDDASRSNCGILIRTNAYWPWPYARGQGLLTPFNVTAYGAIQVTYYAGYSFDTLPSAFRWACNTLVARMRFILPVGFQLSGDTYEQKSINILQSERDYLMGLVVGRLFPYKNFNFGRQ